MTERAAHVITCDDLRVEIGGKFIVVGMYTGGIVIPANEMAVNQIIFLFMISTEIDNPFESLACEITLPGSDPIRINISLSNAPVDEKMRSLGARRRIYNFPMMIANPIFRPGRVEGKVIHESGELVPIGLPLIIKALTNENSPAPK
jgi:hypothetical protein